jgi:hypothetical protein
LRAFTPEKERKKERVAKRAAKLIDDVMPRKGTPQRASVSFRRESKTKL